MNIETLKLLDEKGEVIENTEWNGLRLFDGRVIDAPGQINFQAGKFRPSNFGRFRSLFT